MASLFPATVPTLPVRRVRTGRPRGARTRRVVDEYTDADANVDYGHGGDAEGSDGSVSDTAGRDHKGGAEAGADVGDGVVAVAPVSLGGVELEHGQRGGVRLLKSANGWQWEFAWAEQDSEGHTGDHKLRSTKGEQDLLVPPARVVHEPVEAPDTATSLEYLRQMCSKYEHLGLDELVGPELRLELERERQRGSGIPARGNEHFTGAVTARETPGSDDTFAGHIMAVVSHGHARLARKLLLYPGGELGNELFIAAFAPKSNHITLRRPLLRFIPYSTPIERFPTSILQIATSPADSPHHNDKHGTPLAVRLHSTTHLYLLRPHAGYDPSNPASGPPAHLVHVASLSTGETGGARHADVALDPKEWVRAAVVDARGAVRVWREVREDGGYLTGLAARGMVLDMVRPPVALSGGEVRRRVVWGTDGASIVVLSDHDAVSIDLTDEQHPSVDILNLPRPMRFIDAEPTALARGVSHTCVITTESILWLDEASTGEPALSWRHDLGTRATHARILHIPHLMHDRYAIYTRGGHTFTIFHVSTDGPTRLLGTPYTIILPSLPLHGVSGRYGAVEYALLDIAEPTEGARAAWRVVALGADGAVRVCAMDEGNEVEVDDKRALDLKAVWDVEMEQRGRKGPDEGLPEDGLDKRETARTMYDMRWAWEALNPEEENVQRLTPDEMGRYLRELDAPFEHFMTAAELARDAVLPVWTPDAEPIRSHNLRALPLAPCDPADLNAYTSLPYERDFVPVLAPPSTTTIRVQRSDIDGVSAPTADSPDQHLDSISDVYAHILATYPLPAVPESTAHRVRARHHRDVAGLALDLVLSRVVLAGEEDDVPNLDRAAEDVREAARTGARRRPAPGEAGEAGEGDDDAVLAQAASLSLNERDPPRIVLHIVKPGMEREGDGEGGNEEAAGKRVVSTPALLAGSGANAIPADSDGGDNVKRGQTSALDDLTVRALLSDWTPGANPREYTWKSWLDVEGDDAASVHAAAGAVAGKHGSRPHPLTLTSDRTNRPIRPLPSPRGSPGPHGGRARAGGWQGGASAGSALGTAGTAAYPGVGSSLPLFAYEAPVYGAAPPRANRGLGLAGAAGAGSSSRPLASLHRADTHGPVSVASDLKLGLPGVASGAPGPHTLALGRAYRQASPRSSPPPTPRVGEAATQVERGLYGGRLGMALPGAGAGAGAAGGKKKVKKRLGGF